MAALPGSRAAALVGVHRLETVAVFRFLFGVKKEQPSGKHPLAPRSKKETNKKHPRVGRNQLPRVFSVYYLLLASAGRNRRVRVYTISWMAQSLSARQTSQPSVQAGGTGVRGNM